MGDVSVLRRIARKAVGEQLTTALNAASTNTYLDEIDVSTYDWFTFTIKIVTSANPTAQTFELFWGFSPETITTDAPTFLSGDEYSSGAITYITSANTRYYTTVARQPLAQYLCVWWDAVGNITDDTVTIDITCTLGR